MGPDGVRSRTKGQVSYGRKEGGGEDCVCWPCPACTKGDRATTDLKLTPPRSGMIQEVVV